MFRFNFNVETEGSSAFDATPEVETEPSPRHEKPFGQVSLSSLLDALPPLISYSPLAVPLSSQRPLTLARRDLFDARFQLISLGASEPDAESDELHTSDLDFVDAPSDLVPGVYEGGLKTWECSLDLVDTLDDMYGAEVAQSLRGRRLLELGCGTAVPSLYLAYKLFASEPPKDAQQETHIHLQDYNELVLRLVTLPNLLLAWYMSPASAAFRAQSPLADADPLPPADPTLAGELPITPELKTAFVDALSCHRISLRLFTGSWADFDLQRAGGRYDVLLTSETIYRTDSLGALVDLLWRSYPHSDAEASSLEEAAGGLSLSDPESKSKSAPVCLVAAKLVYFGVGGGVTEFVRAVNHPESCVGGAGDAQRTAGTVETVLERKAGVNRSVMRVRWV